MKRVVAISDFHCGHIAGLTPPEYQFHPVGKKVQKPLWSFYAAKLKELQPIDLLVVLGDAIDGTGGRSGGVEQTLPDLKDQAFAAARCINEARAKKVIMVHGTPYHVTSQEGTDFEDFTAQQVGADIGGHLWADVNGRVFDLKHKIGGSGIPHGRSTAIKREQVWNMLWAERKANPRSDIILRGHVHYFDYTGNGRWLGMTMPALQGPGSKFGVRQCSGVVDFGLVHFDISEKGAMTWNWHLLEVVAPVTAIKC